MPAIPVTVTATIDSSDLPSGGGSAYSIRPRIYRADKSVSAFKAVGNALYLRAGVEIEFKGKLYAPTVDVLIPIPTPQAGKNYAVRIKPGSTATDYSDLLQAYQYPDASPTGSVIIGGYHVMPGSPATGLSSGGSSSGVTLLTPSIWDDSYRPTCDPRGMVRIGLDDWIDIYFQGDLSNDDGISRNGDTILSGSNPPRIPSSCGGNGSTKFTTLNWWEANEHLRQWGKRLPLYELMCIAAFGTNEGDGRRVKPTLTGLYSGYAGSSDANFISVWGLIQVTGCMWIWCADGAYLPDALVTPKSDGWPFDTFETGGRGKQILKNQSGATAVLFGGSSTYGNKTNDGTGNHPDVFGVAGSRCMETCEKLIDNSENIAIRGCAPHVSR